MTCGVDIVQIDRIRTLKNKDSFLLRCFTQNERDYFAAKADPYPSIAANFAAKEAFAKALGTGVRGFDLADIAVLRDDLGKPYFVFGDRITPPKWVDVSLSHDGDMAIAFVIMEK